MAKVVIPVLACLLMVAITGIIYSLKTIVKVAMDWLLVITPLLMIIGRSTLWLLQPDYFACRV